MSAAYIGAQMMADIASLRIVTVAGFSVDAGTLVYPFTFTLRDLVHKTGGRRAADTLVIAAGALNLVMAGLFSLVANLPADLSVGPQLEFGTVLGPIWRIVVASIVAEVTAELVDGAAYQWWVNRFGSRRQWLRVLVSNGVSVPLDSALFVGLAFIGRMEPGVVFAIFVANVVIKYAITAVSLPMIYLVRERRPQA